MAKKQVGVSLRKPPPVDVDSFVAGDAKPATATDIRALAPVKAPANEITLRTEVGAEMREVTVMLPVELARKMSLRCAEKDRDASNLVADALAAHLGAAPAPTRKAKAVASGSLASWTRSLASLFRARLFAI